MMMVVEGVEMMTINKHHVCQHRHLTRRLLYLHGDLARYLVGLALVALGCGHERVVDDLQEE